MLQHLSIIIAFSVIAIICTETVDYCWREYTGEIPEDAVVAGRDINNNNVYIGQAYVDNEGLITVQIKNGDKEVYAPIHGAKRIEDYIKILCGPLDNFAWLPTNASRLHIDSVNKRAVIGGHGQGYGRIYVGRIGYEGGTQIGKVDAFTVGNSAFFWVDKHKREASVQSYEVLVYDKK